MAVFTATPDGDPAALAAALWDLDGWARRRRRPAAGAMAGLPPTGPDDLAPGFVLSAAVLRHLQADPLLPAELLPAGLARGPPCGTPTTGGTGGYRQVLRRLGPVGVTGPAVGPRHRWRVGRRIGPPRTRRRPREPTARGRTDDTEHSGDGEARSPAGWW